MQFAIRTVGWVKSPAGQQGARFDVPRFTTVQLEHFIPKSITHSPKRALNMVPMHSLNLGQIGKWNPISLDMWHIFGDSVGKEVVGNIYTCDLKPVKGRKPSISKDVKVVVATPKIILLEVHVVQAGCLEPSLLHSQCCPGLSRIELDELQILQSRDRRKTKDMVYCRGMSQCESQTNPTSSMRTWAEYAVRRTHSAKSLSCSVVAKRRGCKMRTPWIYQCLISICLVLNGFEFLCISDIYFGKPYLKAKLYKCNQSSDGDCMANRWHIMFARDFITALG